ncbi:NAD-dependent epimerase/dehydratase family protein [Rossellomorea vietnamensis]|uniref:NAD-dependent epimerase/dehydratase family protein n=1 Tax=Rossellomorea vietnamensis TaxID=218284 RepID=UPI001CCA3615|nr:NAD-dependent epimerase/dehydratase family protein [Rossellomorea vietnamensis]MCA0150372.1 NAD-dependent epimerase/dehydratase family protein [Rossellomorea vietnamensis]
MKKILVTGANSYIGTSFETWVSQYPDKYSVERISLRDDLWKEVSFKDYDVVFHTAAIVHVKENDESEYYRVNTDLTIEIAQKAKREAVQQFIFLSTMGVYGTETGYITKETPPTPKTPYAKSKYEAEKALSEMHSSDFNIAILRPPIVYGKGCPGNYRKLANMAIKLPFFPRVENERSMIYIDHLSEFIRLIIEKRIGGILFPQNKEYVNTTKLVRHVSAAYNKDIKVSKLFNWAISLGQKNSDVFRKVFGTFIYDKAMPGGPGFKVVGESLDYETTSFEESIKCTEGREQSNE